MESPSPLLLNLDKDVNDCVRDFYRIAYEQPIGQFKHAVLDRFSQLLPIDAGFWITRSELESPFWDDDSFAYQLPDGVMQHYIDHPLVAAQAQDITIALLAETNTVRNILELIPPEEWLKSDMYIHHCKKFDLEYSLVAVSCNPVNQMMNSMSFVRGEKNQPFTEQDKALAQFLLPHLLEAMRINILNVFRAGDSDEKAFRAVVDKHGYIFEAEESFINYLTPLGAITDNHLDLDGVSGGKYQHLVRFNSSQRNDNGIISIEVICRDQHVKLTPRKREVCSLLVEGLSNKQIAQQLFISPATVTNHLKELYKAFSVTSRQQLIAYLMRQKDISLDTQPKI